MPVSCHIVIPDKVRAPNDRRVILDCDPGIDDAIALALAFARLDVVGVTTCGGNMPPEVTAANARAVCDLLGQEEVQVCMGTSIDFTAGAGARHHGLDGLGGAPLRRRDRALSPIPSATFIQQMVSAEPGLWIVATGPLTNVWQAFHDRPDLAVKLGGISWMGGCHGPGNVTPLAEYNSYIDPVAARYVFRDLQAPLLVTGLDVARSVLATLPWIESQFSESSLVTNFFRNALSSYVLSQRRSTTLPGVPLHDALAVLRLATPELFSSSAENVDVVVDSEQARGLTYFDKRPRLDTMPDNCSWTHSVNDPNRILAEVVDSVRSLS